MAWERFDRYEAGDRKLICTRSGGLNMPQYEDAAEYGREVRKSRRENEAARKAVRTAERAKRAERMSGGATA